MSKKFWRSGMIDKKVIAEREREEHINRLEMSIHFLKRELNSEYGMKECSKYAIVHTSDNRSHKVKIADEYDEVRVGDNLMLDFRNWLRKNAQMRCDADIEFGRKIEALENENNTRDI